jgi:hypothetical protein
MGEITNAGTTKILALAGMRTAKKPAMSVLSYR